MKKGYLILVAVFTAFMLTACGMSAEEISTYMTSLESSYQNGAYEQAVSEVKKLEKSYKNMTDEQKGKFDELKPLVEYAVESVGAINEGLNNAQSFYDQKMYYEASQELEKLTAAYTMPPTEQKAFDEKKTAVDAAIKSWKVTEALQKTEAAYNNADYDTAANELATVDTSALSEEQNQLYQSLQNKIKMSQLLLQAEREFNNGNLNSASSTLSSINTAYLSAEQNQKYSSLNKKVTDAKAAANKITHDRARKIAAGALGVPESSVSITDMGEYYQAISEYYNYENNEKEEGACKIDKATGGVFERVG